MAHRNESYVPLLCDYPDSEKINNISEGSEAMFCRLLAKCDDKGNYHGEPKRLLGKLFTLRYENRTMTAQKVLRLRNELVTATLITCYVVDTVTYIHINNCKKSLRKDVALKVYFPDFVETTQVFDTKEVNETGTKRNESVTGCNETLPPIQSNPTPNQTNKKKFIPPTLEEVQDYIKKKNYDIDPKVFFEYFTESNWIDSMGKPVLNWKQKIISWSGDRQKGIQGADKIKLFPISGKTCSKQGCGLPAIYKDTSGAYDYYRCSDHLPAKVKQKYY